MSEFNLPDGYSFDPDTGQLSYGGSSIATIGAGTVTTLNGETYEHDGSTFVLDTPIQIPVNGVTPDGFMEAVNGVLAVGS